MKKITLLLLLFSAVSFSQSIMIKSVETYGGFASIKKQLITIDENNETTTVELQKHNTKGITPNMLELKKELDKYLNKGYKIVSTNSHSFGWQGVFTIEQTYVLQIAP